MKLRFWLLAMDVTGWLDLITTRLWLWTVGHAGASVDYDDEGDPEPGTEPF